MPLLRSLIIAVLGLAIPSAAAPTPADPSLTYETFRAPPVSLRSGQIANTAGDFGLPLPMPKGPVAVRFFNSTIVDKDGIEVPTTEVYVHHWVMYSDPDPAAQMNSSTHNFGYCSNLNNVWGIGAELRGVTYYYPKPYAIILNGLEQFGVNLHFIRTTNVPGGGAGIQECIECRCPDSAPPLHPKGMVGCCGDGTQCYGMENSTLQDAREYYLQYTVGYEPVTEEHQPLTIFTLDATAKETYDCMIQYQIPALADGEIHTLQTMVNISNNMTMAFLELHQHIGGLNMTVEHYRNGENLGMICGEAPIYGNGTEVGNERDYLVDIPTCTWGPPGYRVQAGDQFRLTSLYTNRGLPGGNPWHSGVMAIVFLAAVSEQTPVQACTNRVHHDCGIPPYNSKALCMGCAQYFWADLERFHCDNATVEKICENTFNGSVVPTPSEIDDMSLTATRNLDGSTTINVTGPRDVWFSVGYNPAKPLMNGTVALVYAADAKGQPSLQARQLGSHVPGTVLPTPLAPVITTSSDAVTIVVNVTLPNAGDGEADAFCWLFAHGSSMTFNYHGATRGYSCHF